MARLVPNSFLKPLPLLYQEKKIKSFEVPAPGNFPYTICKSRKLKSWPCLQFFPYKIAIMKEKKVCPNKFAIEKEMIEIFAREISGKFA